MGDLQAFRRGLREAPEYTERVLQEAMTEATLRMENEWKENLHEHSASGSTSGSITSDVASTPAGVLGVVGSDQASALFLELGTRPHWVGEKGLEALGNWAVKRLGVSKDEAPDVAYAIATKIAREGTPARHLMAKSASAAEGEIVAMFERAAAQVAEYLVGGGT
jgi:hypothetical protein